MSIYVYGLDLGQQQDFTAAVIIEARGTTQSAAYKGEAFGITLPIERKYELSPMSRVEVRHIERFPLHTPYKEIAARVALTLPKIPKPCYLAVDQTGVGRGVLEMLYGSNPIGITITAGSEAQPGVMQHEWRVPKRDLVSTMQVLMQNKQFGIAKGLELRELLAREMQNFRAKISTSGHDTYEAWREADHDDLVLACAMACWLADQTFRLFTAKVRQAMKTSWTPQEYQISPV